MRDLVIDVLVKTHPPDYDCLAPMLRSMKFVSGYRNLVLLLEEQYPEPPDLPPRVVIARSRRYVGTDYPSNYGAVIERLRAWAYTDADRVVFLDSDCAWCRPVDLRTEPTILAERPVVLWRAWGEPNGTGDGWRPAAARTLGYDPSRATMVRYPFCFPRDVLRACWDFVGGEERLRGLMTEAERRRNAPYCPPVDWPVLGCFALDHAPGAVTARHWSQAGAHTVFHYLSHERPMTPSVRARLRELGLL